MGKGTGVGGGRTAAGMELRRLASLLSVEVGEIIEINVLVRDSLRRGVTLQFLPFVQRCEFIFWADVTVIYVQMLLLYTTAILPVGIHLCTAPDCNPPPCVDILTHI